MSRLPDFLACCVLWHASLSTDAAAHQGDVIYPMFELPSSDLPDLHDGTLEDWEAVLPDASINHNDFIWEANAVASIAVEDMAFRIFLAWHNTSQRIYIGFEGIDDEYVPLSEDTHGNGAFSVMVDGDHSGGKFRYYSFAGDTEEEQRRLTGSQAQNYHATPQEVDGRHLFVLGQASWAREPPWADIGAFEIGESPTLSVLEMALTPWDDLNLDGPEVSRRSTLVAGDIIGLNLTVMDFDLDDPTAVDGYFRLGPNVVVEQSGDYFNAGFSDNAVDVELVPCNRGDCSRGSDTAVLANSWGRIKASLK